jgi:hypothetical protein
VSDLLGGIPMSTEARVHYDRKRRRAMSAMARACGLEPEKFADPDALWLAICTEMAGGKMQSPANQTVDGDPFALFLTARCSNHRVEWEGTYVIKSPTGHAIDEFEANKMIAFLKEKQPDCQECGEPITTWSSDMTRLSVFADKQRQLGKVTNEVAT